ncbi:MAG: hypothetical protein FJ297_08110 [Planctomycetes bacterium]|nr:hypothetical protein [Planctomycetota bacterium]
MPRVLCLAGIVVSILVFIIFVLHLVVQFSFAPSTTSSLMMDIVFIICSLGLGFLSWTTFREQD